MPNHPPTELFEPNIGNDLNRKLTRVIEAFHKTGKILAEEANHRSRYPGDRNEAEDILADVATMIVTLRMISDRAHRAANDLAERINQHPEIGGYCFDDDDDDRDVPCAPAHLVADLLATPNT